MTRNCKKNIIAGSPKHRVNISSEKECYMEKHFKSDCVILTYRKIKKAK